MSPSPEESVLRGPTLADRLRRGPLPFPNTLHIAHGVAKALREFHKKGKSHGDVSPRAVQLQGDSATLPMPAAGWLPASLWQQDVHAFGELLRLLLPDPPDAPPSPAFPPRLSEPGVWLAARQVVDSCLADPPRPQWTMQQVAIELQLLDLAARQLSRGKPIDPPPAPAPFPRPAPSSPAIEFAPAEPPLSGVPCPRCGAPYVQPSAPRSDFEEALDLFRLSLLRCHRCAYRYFKLFGIRISKGSDQD